MKLIMVERDTGRPRGFGFVTFSDRRAMEDAINEMHNKELNGRQISVNKAEPRVGSDDPGYGYGGGGYSSGGRGGYRAGSDDLPPGGNTDCFKCGRPGHWARECPSSGAGGARFSSRSRIVRGGGGGGAGRDRFGGGDRYGDRHVDDRYDGGRYGDRTRLDGRDSSKYSGGGGRDRYANDHYPPASSERFSGSKYSGGPDRSLHDGYSKERSFDRDGGPRGGGDRYATGGGSRYEGGGGGGGGYRERAGPYDRPSKGGRPSYDDRY